MESVTLFDFVREICLYFERKIPGNETLDQWFNTLANIPAEPLPWIAQKIKGLDAFPRNFPGAIKHYWGEWLEANPNRRMKERELGCSGCFAGYIQVSSFEESLGRYYNTTFRCASCRPRYPQAMKLATVESLALEGYFKPLGYLTSFRYADILPDPEPRTMQTSPVERGPIDKIVGQVASQYDF